MAVAGAGAGAEIMDKVGAGAENKSFRLRNSDKILKILENANKLVNVQEPEAVEPVY